MPHMAGCLCPAHTRHIRTCTCAACLCMYAPCLPPLHRVVRVGHCLPKVLILAAWWLWWPVSQWEWDGWRLVGCEINAGSRLPLRICRSGLCDA